MPDKTTVQSAARRLRYTLTQAAEHVVEQQQRAPAELDMIASSISLSTVLFGRLGPIGWSAVEARRRHLATVLAFTP